MDHFLYKNGVLHAEDVAIPILSRGWGTVLCVFNGNIDPSFSII